MAGYSLNLDARLIKPTALPVIMSGLAICRLRKSSARCALTGRRAGPRRPTSTRITFSRRNRRVTKAARRFGSGTGSDHPAAAGYLDELASLHQSDPNIVFHGYVAEDDVASFFTQARRAIFDYDSTTGSSGVLHQAAIYGTPAAYPLMGDFIDVTEREGLTGFNFKPLNQSALEQAIETCLADTQLGQSYADTNIDVSKGVTMGTVVSIQLQLLKKVRAGKFNRLRGADNRALQVKQANY